VLLAGCGGSPLSPSELRDQAGQICRQMVQQSSTIRRPKAPSGTAAFLNQGIAVLKPGVEQLRSLDPPNADADTYHRAVQSLSDQVANLEQTEREVRRGGDPVSAVQSLQQRLTPLQTQADSDWRTLGISACVSR